MACDTLDGRRGTAGVVSQLQMVESQSGNFDGYNKDFDPVCDALGNGAGTINAIGLPEDLEDVFPGLGGMVNEYAPHHHQAADIQVNSHFVMFGADILIYGSNRVSFNYFEEEEVEQAR